MRHLVTGGSGFLGSLIAKYFHALGDQVVVLDEWQDSSQPEEIKYFKGSILNREIVRTALHDVDIVHHVAALVPVTKAGNKFYQVNSEGSKIIAEESVAQKVKRFVHLSSSAVYGICPSPITNSSPIKPIEAYGKSKYEGELAVRAAAAKSNMDLVVIRPRTILGPERLGILRMLFEWIKDNCNIYLIGDGANKLQFVQVSDFMDLYMLIHKSNKTGEFNVGTDRFGTVREALENLCAHARSKSKVIGLPRSLTVNILKFLDVLRLSPLGPYHYLTYGESIYFDIQPLLEIGWKPRYSNDEMLQEAYDAFVLQSGQFNETEYGSPHRRRVKEFALNLVKFLSTNN